MLSILTRPSSLEQIKEFLQIDDDAVKVNCFTLLRHILSRIFDPVQTDSWSSLSSGNFSPNKEASSKNEEQELADVKKSVKEDLFQFMSTIVQVVIAFELSAGSAATEPEEGAAHARTITAVMKHS